MFSLTFCCAFLVRLVLFKLLTNGSRPEHRIMPFFDLVTGDMAEQILGINACSGKELWGAGNYKCVPFFIIQVVRLYVLLRLLELHYQANHSWFVHPPTPFSCVPQGISLFNVCTTPRRTELLCRRGLWALSQRLHDHSSDTHSHHLSFLSLVLEGPTLLAFDLVLWPSPLQIGRAHV